MTEIERPDNWCPSCRTAPCRLEDDDSFGDTLEACMAVFCTVMSFAFLIIVMLGVMSLQ